MHGLLARLPLYRLQRRWGRAWLLPASYTFSVTHACNARCRTCRAYERPQRDLTVDEYRRIVDSIDQRALWLTVSGGEPFLRRDLEAVVEVLLAGLRPRAVNIPTNGSLPQRVEDTLSALSGRHRDRHFVVNISLDDIGERHDRLRGQPGAWKTAMQTFAAVRELQRRRKNITLGIHTVISAENVRRFDEISDRLLALRPDSYVTEIAQHRSELLSTELDIVPRAEDYAAVAAKMGRPHANPHATRMGWLIALARRHYYADVMRQLAGKPARRACYAATASCQVLPDGEVVACCVRCATLGHLRAADYSFPSVWRSARARRVRDEIHRQRCVCSLANQAYVNMALDPPQLISAVLGAPFDIARRWSAARGRRR